MQGVIELVGIDGLSDVIVHAGGEAALAIASHDVGGHRQDRNVLPDVFPLAQLPGGGQPIHHRHLHVHQDQVVGSLGRHIQCDGTIAGHAHFGAHRLQQLQRHLLIELVVFRQQDLQAVEAIVMGRLGWLEGEGRCLLPEQADDGIEQHGGADRFDQYPIKTGSIGLAKDLLAPVAGHHDPIGAPARTSGDETTPRLDAVQSRHAPVQQHHLIGGSLLLGIRDHLQGLLAGLCSVHHKAHATQQGGQNGTSTGAVVGHQHAAAAQIQARQIAGSAPATAEPGGKPEGAALARLALHAHLAPHQARQLAANGKAKPGAAVFAGGGAVRLLE